MLVGVHAAPDETRTGLALSRLTSGHQSGSGVSRSRMLSWVSYSAYHKLRSSSGERAITGPQKALFLLQVVCHLADLSHAKIV